MRAYKLDSFLPEQSQFSIIEEFSALNPKRKMLLCKHLFTGNRTAFQESVLLIWPQAQARDVEKLSKFIKLLQHSSH